MMTDPMRKVTEDKDLLGKIQNFVSGFLGYYDRERRRDADKLLRETIAQRYEEQWTRVSATQAKLVAAKQLEFVDDIETAAIKIRTFVDRIKTAPRGYAGFFDAVRVNQDELDALYRYDLALLGGAEDVKAAVDALEAAVGTEGLVDAIAKLVEVSQASNTLYDRRDEAVLAS
jgi:hypothetical protein